ncbi:MAG: type II toxin-antitoxin system RelE family toxin [Anaerolineales bacterium]
MSKYNVRILEAAVQDLAKIDHDTARRIVQKIYRLAENLELTRLEMLTGDLVGFYKLRVGDYRVIFEVLWEEKNILIHAIDHRSRIYRKR